MSNHQCTCTGGELVPSMAFVSCTPSDSAPKKYDFTTGGLPSELLPKMLRSGFSISTNVSVMVQSLPLLGSRMNPNAFSVSSPLPPDRNDQCVGPAVTTSLTVGKMMAGPASGLGAGQVGSAPATIDTLISMDRNPEWKK